MPKGNYKYTEAERNFVLMLALATKRPWTSLDSLIRGLAERGCLSFLGPNANAKFLHWPHQRGYAWQKKYGWDLSDVREAEFPLPKEEEIDDRLLRDRLRRQEHFHKHVLDGVGDPFKTARALHFLEGSIEAQVTRRMSRPMTPQTLIDLIMSIFRKFQGQNPDDIELLNAIAQEVTRFRYVPATTTP